MACLPKTPIVTRAASLAHRPGPPSGSPQPSSTTTRRPFRFAVEARASMVTEYSVPVEHHSSSKFPSASTETPSTWTPSRSASSNLLRMLYSRAGDLPRRGRPPRGRGVLAQHRGRRLPALPRPGRRARRHRGAARPRPVAEHPRGRDRRLAGRLAGRQPAQHRHRSRHRHRQAVAQAAGRRTATGCSSPTSSRRCSSSPNATASTTATTASSGAPASTSCTSWPTPRASGCASGRCGSSRTRPARTATAAGCGRRRSR